ncbi:MAG: septum formation initiator family protein [Pseudomonadota bacterium]
MGNLSLTGLAAQSESSWGMNLLLALLMLLLVSTLAVLLLSADGLRRTQRLQAEVSQTRQEISALQARNAALSGEVKNLKHGLEAAEERARSDLGLISENESFYQIVASD